MGEYIDLNWKTVDNTLSERMIDNSLIHLLDRVQKKMSKTTIICNRKLKRLHILKNYDHFVEIKMKIKEKLNNNEEYESTSSSTKDFSDGSDGENLNGIKDVEENIEQNKQSSQHENEHDALPKDETNNSVSVNNGVSQLTNNDEKHEPETEDHPEENDEQSSLDENEQSQDKSHDLMLTNDVQQLTNNHEKNELDADDNSIKDSMRSCNIDSLLENHSDDEIDKLVIDENSTEDLINRHDNDDAMENHSNVISDDEENKLETHDNSTKDSINSPENDNVTGNNNKDTLPQRDRPTLKIIMTEIVKPRYTVIQNPQTIINTTKKLIHNQKSTDELSGENKSIELKSSQKNYSSIQESNEDDINTDNSINSTRSETTIRIKKRGIKNKNKRIKRKDIILNNNQNLGSHFHEILDHKNDSDTLETLNSPMIEGDDEIDNSDTVMDSVNFSKPTGKISSIKNRKLKSPLSDERAALTYTLEHMAYVKHRQERLNHDVKFFNENYINIENESREESISEPENDLLQSNFLAKRPTTLDEFIQGNNLTPLDDKASVFTLDDLCEDEDLFVMEIPKSVINQDLLGQKMVVRNFDMTIGRTNYKLHRLKNEALTCILKENNERMAFKAVNIKPKGTFVVKRILAPNTEDIYFHHTLDISNNNKCPFPKNLKIRNPLENNNKRLKKYKKKIRKDGKKKAKRNI